MDDVGNEPQLQEANEPEKAGVSKDEWDADSHLAFSPDGRLGTSMRNFTLKYGGFDLDITRDQTPVRAVVFSGPEFDHFEDEPEES
jgi:hypothetical protein